MERRAHGGWVLIDQFIGERPEFGPQAQGPLQVVSLQGKTVHADKVQAGIVRGRLSPELPGSQKIEARAEAGFANGEAAFSHGLFVQSLEALGQTVVVQEDMTGFGQSVGAGEIHVVEPGGDWLTRLIPLQVSGFQVLIRPRSAGLRGVAHRPNSRVICSHQRAMRSSVRSNSFSSSSASPTN